MSVFPQPVSRPEQMAKLVAENKALRNKVINLEHELYVMRNTDLFKKIRWLEKRYDDTLREYKQANDAHLRYGKEFVDWMEDTRSKNEELILKNEELIKENSRLRVENEELKNTRLH